jgi:hypothetical protein
MGLCVETEDGNVVLLWFTRATADPYNEDLRTYLTTVTRWAPIPDLRAYSSVGQEISTRRFR